MQYPRQADNYDIDIFNSNFMELAGNVISLDTEKFDKTEAQGLFKDVSFDKNTGIITFLLYNGSSKTIDTLLEKIAVNFDFDREAQRLVIVLDDGTEKYVDLSSFITQYEFMDSDTIVFVLGNDGKVSAKIKGGSIGEEHLRQNYLADIKVESAKAESALLGAQESQKKAEDAEAESVAWATASAESADVAKANATAALNSAAAAKTSESNSKISAANADIYANKSQSYAEGGTGTREGEDTDNAKYYSQQAELFAGKAEEASSSIDIRNKIITFDSQDELDPESSEEMPLMESGHTMEYFMKSISIAFKNIRWMKKIWEAMNYSTEEIDTGLKWVDGAKIYKKTIPYILPKEITGNVDIPHNITNFGICIELQVVTINTDGYLIPYIHKDCFTSVNRVTNTRIVLSIVNDKWIQLGGSKFMFTMIYCKQ